MSLARKSFSNFLGGVVPTIASILTVPIVVKYLGDTQYGLFTLVSAIVGYFALIDINVTAGSVKYLSEHHARGESNDVNQVISFGGFIYFLIGLIGGACIFIFADTLVRSFFNIPPNLHEVASSTLRITAFAFFFGQMQVYLLSIPQALQRYDLSSMVESVFGALTPISTVLVVIFGGGLVEIVVVRLLLSIINCVILIKSVKKLIPFFRITKPNSVVVKKLSSFSAFSYLSKVAAIFHVTGDKLLLGAMTNMQLVAYYSVPSLLVNRVFGLIFRLGSVIFPIASSIQARNNSEELRYVYLTSTRYYTYLNGSLSVLLFFFSREILHYWAGSTFGQVAANIMMIIIITTFFDSLTNLPSLVNDGLGKPLYTSVQSILRSASCMLLSYIAIQQFGYIGLVWSYLITSSLFGLGLIFYVHGRSVPISIRDVYIEAYKPTLLPLLALMIISFYLSNREVLLIFDSLLIFIFLSALILVYGWLIVCLPEHKIIISKYLKLKLSRFQ